MMLECCKSCSEGHECEQSCSGFEQLGAAPPVAPEIQGNRAQPPGMAAEMLNCLEGGCEEGGDLVAIFKMGRAAGRGFNVKTTRPRSGLARLAFVLGTWAA